MNVLEKILEEIREIEKKYVVGHNVLFALGATGMATEISSIIRSHMVDVPKCGECSRRKWYQMGCKMLEIPIGLIVRILCQQKIWIRNQSGSYMDLL